jgi:hypothetical protein
LIAWYPIPNLRHNTNRLSAQLSIRLISCVARNSVHPSIYTPLRACTSSTRLSLMSHEVGAIVFPTSHPSKHQPCELSFLGSRSKTPCTIRLTQPHPEPSVYLQYTIKDLVPDKSSIEDVSESLHEELQLNTSDKKKGKFKIISLCLVDLCPIVHTEDLDKSTLSPAFVELAKQKEIQIVVNWNSIPERRRHSLRLSFGVLKSTGSSDKHVRFHLGDDRPWTISPNIDDVGGTGRGKSCCACVALK